MITLEQPTATTPVGAARSVLRGLDAGALGLDVPAPLELAAGISCYRVRASDHRPGATLEDLAWRWGWRYFLTSTGTLLPAAVDVQPARDAGAWVGGFAIGGGLTELIDALASARTAGADGELRLLHAPSLHWQGLWIRGPKTRLITAAGDRITSVASLDGRLRSAKAAEDLHKGGPTHEKGTTADRAGAGSPRGSNDPGPGPDHHDRCDGDRPGEGGR